MRWMRSPARCNPENGETHILGIKDNNFCDLQHSGPPPASTRFLPSEPELSWVQRETTWDEDTNGSQLEKDEGEKKKMTRK